ncbi:MAG: TrbG/VirB9 family P-type conjugative transfer protein [Synergistaceae bacterium]|jgi:type IV secretion system protein VirB9|nr:TrbG/VirB9 family P-type conjugative transfer protein [Synergistaceae bacterium]
MHKERAYLRFMLLLTVLCSALSAFPRAASSEEAVPLPSRLEGRSGAVPANDESKMVEEWFRATGVAPGENSSPSPRPYMMNRARRDFLFGAARPTILCRTGMITDIELEPGEQVKNFSISDGQRWSISAAWNGDAVNLVTHILLRPFFPGLKTSLTIYTDRRTYSLDLLSSLDGLHMAYVGFRYPTEAPPHEDEPIPSGRYRDLLVEYKIIEDSAGSEKPAVQKRVDAAELKFGYSIKPVKGGKKKISWMPKSVYDSNGRTYFVMPNNAEKVMEQLSLFVTRGDERLLMPVKAVKDDLLMAETVFAEALLRLDGDEVSIVRPRQGN